MSEKAISLDNLATFKSKADTAYASASDLSNKQDTLVNQTNIKSINNNSLLGSGNLDVGFVMVDEVSFDNWPNERAAIIAAWPNVIYRKIADKELYYPACIKSSTYYIMINVKLSQASQVSSSVLVNYLYFSVMGPKADGTFNVGVNDFLHSSAIPNCGAISNALASYMANPMTTAGDIIVGGTDGAPNRLAKGTAGQVLAMDSNAATPEWKSISPGTTFVYASGTWATDKAAIEAAWPNVVYIKDVNGFKRCFYPCYKLDNAGVYYYSMIYITPANGQGSTGGQFHTFSFNFNSNTTVMPLDVGNLICVNTVNNKGNEVPSSFAVRTYVANQLASYMANPMTAQGDVIIGGASGAATRLAKGTAGQVLTMNSSGTAPEWQANIPSELNYLSTAPTADNTNGTLKLVVLTSEPATRYNGYIYVVLGSNS